MRINNFLIGLFLLFSVTTTLYPQVYRITNNPLSDRNPRILKDLDERIWCFWESGSLQNYEIKTSYFENGQWSDEQVVADYSNYFYNVDLDEESGKIWLVVIYYGDSLKVYSGQVSGFQEIATFVSGGIEGTTINVIDSTDIWMDLHPGLQNYLTHFDGVQFQEYPTVGLSSGLCEYIKKPKSSVLVNRNKIYYTREGYWHCSGGGGDGYLDYLFYIDFNDPQFNENIIELDLQSNASTLGQDADSFIYFFNIHYNDSTTQNNLTVVDYNANTVYTKIQNLNFFPQIATKYDSVCVVGWIRDSTINYKAINDTQIYKTGSISKSEIFNASSFYDLKIQKDAGNFVWIVFSGRIDGQNEIFAAREEFSTELDTNYILSTKGNDFLNTIPEDVKLSQNYPNPFNPETIINYQIAVHDFVTLKVYNTLGQEVLTLVNDYKPAGSYEINFNASRLPSGVYIYRLTAGNLSLAKKLILMK